MPSYMYGDWNKLLNYLDNLKTANGRLKRVMKEVAHEVEERVKENIKEGRLELAPLQEYYKQRKVAKGLNEQILIATGEYVEKIQVIDVSESNGKITFVVGVPEGITIHAEQGREIDAGYLAEILEYGTMDGRIPGRPAFNLTYEEIKDELPNKILALIEDEIFVLKGGNKSGIS